MTHRAGDAVPDNILPIVQETSERLKRLETRFTKFAQSQGFDTQTHRPRWEHGTVHVPSPNSSFADILACVPPDWDDRAITVRVKGDYLATIYTGP